MNAIVQKNMNTLHSMYMEHPNSMSGLTAEGNFLVLGDKKVDISNFDISSLFDGVNPFMGSLDQLTPDDIFNIINVHALATGGPDFVLPDNMYEREQTDEEKLKEIKKENPLMEYVTIIEKPTEFGPKQYFNIVDSTGKDNLFYNDINIDIFSIYETLKLQNGGENISPEDLIAAVRRKLYDVDLMNSTHSDVDLLDEEFRNKMMYQDQLYKGDKSVDVYGNEEHDITLINDDRNAADHQVLTYENNEHGDVVATTHNQNVTGEQVVNGNGEQVSETTGIAEGDSTEEDTMEVEEDEEPKIESILIPIEEFYYIVDSGAEMDEKMRKSVNLWYSIFEDMILYEDFLTPELKEILEQYRKYVMDLQLAEAVLNENQVEACDNLALFEARKQEKQIGNEGKEKVNEISYVLTKKPIVDNAAFVAYAQVIGVILTAAVLLTALALYVINFM